MKYSICSLSFYSNWSHWVPIYAVKGLLWSIRCLWGKLWLTSTTNWRVLLQDMHHLTMKMQSKSLCITENIYCFIWRCLYLVLLPQSDTKLNEGIKNQVPIMQNYRIIEVQYSNISIIPIKYSYRIIWLLICIGKFIARDIFVKF